MAVSNRPYQGTNPIVHHAPLQWLSAQEMEDKLVDPDGHTAFVACRLIALDKCPGVRPIGMGEV